MKYILGIPHIHLQNVGEYPAVRVEDLREGDVLVYNFGSTAVVRGVESPKPGGSMRIVTTVADGRVWTRRYRYDTYVACERARVPTRAVGNVTLVLSEPRAVGVWERARDRLLAVVSANETTLVHGSPGSLLGSTETAAREMLARGY